jgi:ankyrin repeat protein
MIDRLLKAGADANAPLSAAGDTALMVASRTGKTDAIRVLVEAGANVQHERDMGRDHGADVGGVGGDTPMRRGMLVGAGADVNARSNYVAAANGRGFEAAPQ